MKLVFRDTRSDPGPPRDLTQELAQDARVLAILGFLSSSVAQNAADAAQAAAGPLLALSQKARLTQTGNSIFQAFLTPRQQVRALVADGDEPGAQALCRSLSRFFLWAHFSELFQEEVTAQGGELAPQVFYAPATRSLGPPCPTSIRASGPGGRHTNGRRPVHSR